LAYIEHLSDKEEQTSIQETTTKPEIYLHIIFKPLCGYPESISAKQLYDIGIDKEETHIQIDLYFVTEVRLASGRQPNLG